MKRILAILVAIMTITACSVTPAETTGELTISMGSSASTFGLENMDMVTDHYLVDVINTDKNISYGTHSVSSESPVMKLEVASGNTEVTVRAINASGTEIGNGTGSVKVRPNAENSVTVTVSEIMGSANLTIEIHTAITGVEFHAEICKATETEENCIAVPVTGDEEILTGSTELESGFYLVMIKDSEGHSYGSVESVRIFKGSDIRYVAQIGEDRFDVDISIENSILPTPDITIVGGKPEYRDGDIFSISATAEGIKDPVFSWFLDGNLNPKWNSETISGTVAPGKLSEGRHVLTVMVRNSTVLWTENHEFTYLGAAEPSLPAVTEIAGITPDSITISDFSGGSATFTVERRNGKAYDYQVESADSWLKVEKVSTAGLVDTWKVTAESNTGPDTRSTSIKVGSFTVGVIQKAEYQETGKPREIVLDSIYPEMGSGNILYRNMNYRFNAHVEPLSAPQELVWKIESRGTSNKGYGSSNWRVPERDIPYFVEYDQNGNIRAVWDYWLPGVNDNGKYSRDFAIVISTADGSVSRTIEFSIDHDENARITGITPSTLSFPDSQAAVSELSVETATEGSTIVSVLRAPEWLRASETRTEGRNRIFEIEVAPHRGSKDRTGEIVFQDNNGHTMSATVTQKAGNAPGEHYLWLSGADMDENEIVHGGNTADSRYIEIYEKVGENRGWYNVAKSELSYDTDPADDGSLCWAMSASASIHWWADHNRKYIDAFTGLHPEVLAPQPLGGGLVIPAMDFTYDNTVMQVKDKSAIARIFVKNHIDKGDMPDQGLRDMLFIPRIPNDSMHNDNAVYPGWFEDVFRGRVDEVVKTHQTISMSSLHFLIEEAYEKNWSLILTYHLKSRDGYHAVNIWGVKYDDEGNISELIIGDNNSVGEHKDHPAESFLSNYLVRENSNGYVDIGNPDFPNAKDYMGDITNITSLDLGTAIWEEWARDNGLRL